MATLTWTMPGDDLDDFVLADSASSAPSTLVPGTYPIAIKGHPYKLELDSYGTGIRGVTYRRTTLDVFRQAADQSATPGEQSRSTEGYWLRSERSFLYGAGQLLFDSLDDGVDNLIRRQRWLDNWNCEPDVVEGLKMLRGAPTQITLTNATPNYPNRSVSAGAYTYVKTTAAGIYRVDASGATLCTGFAETVSSVASDGYNIWAATAVDATHVKFYSAVAGATAFSAMSAGSQVVPSGTVQSLFYGNGFLLACIGSAIYSVDKTGAIGAVIDTITAVSAGFPFITSVSCSANTWYFVLSVSSINDFPTAIYKLSLDSSGAFTKTSVALPVLGPSEVINAIKVIGQVILIGTTKGFRLGALDTSGNISVGPLIPVVTSDTTGSPNFGVTEFARFGSKVIASYASASEPYGSNIDATFKAGRSTNGTIVIDVSIFTAPLQPAWWYWFRDNADNSPVTASCFIAEHQTTPILITRDDFWVIGSANLISPCSLVTSWITYGLDASKSFIDIEVFHDPLATGDSVKVYYQVEDSTTWNLIGTSQAVGSISNPDPFQLTTSSRRVRFAFVMTAGSTSQATTPRIRRWELRAFPAPKLTDEIMLPIVLFNSVLVGEQEAVAAHLATRDEYDFLAGLAQSGEIVIFQEGSHTEQVKVSKLELQPAKFSIDPDGGYGFYQGWCVVRLLSL